jgi:hypothetical protein
MGTDDSCGSGEPQRVQGAGRRTELIASRGLRSTRATARQRDVSESEPSIVSEPWFLLKTHLTWASAAFEGNRRFGVTYIYSFYGED